jgi:uncharacterized protein YjbI with pentapeptide repeats
VKFKRVTFAACQIREADFSKVAFDRVSFVDCDLTRASFARATVMRSEMHRCTLTGLRGLAELRGFTMRYEDILEHAGLFAAELGIGVEQRS